MIRRLRSSCALWAAVLATVVGASACMMFQSLSLPKGALAPSIGPSDYPDAGAAIVEDVAELEYRSVPLTHGEGARLIVVEDHLRRLKILRPSGLQAATVELTIDGFATVSQVVARSIAPDGSVAVLDPATVAGAARQEPGMRAPDIKVVRFTVPGASVGGIVEYHYQRIYTEPLLVPPYVFADALPMVRSQLTLVAPTSLRIDYRYGRGDTPVAQEPLQKERRDGAERLTFVENNVPALPAEPLMPHPSRHAAWLAVALRSETEAHGMQHYVSWEDHGAVVTKMMRGIYEGARGPWRGDALAERIVNTTRLLTPLTLSGMGVRPPQSAQALRKGAPACSRDAAAFMLAALKGSSARTFPALLAGPMAPPLLADFPALYPFARAVVAVEVTEPMTRGQGCALQPVESGPLCGYAPGDFLFVDPLCRRCGLGVLPPALHGGRALLLGAEKSAIWVDMPVDPPQRHLQHVEASYDLDIDGSLSGTLQARLTGSPAASMREQLTTQGSGAAAVALALELASPRGLTWNLVLPPNIDDPIAPLRCEGRIRAKAAPQGFERFVLPLVELVGPSAPSLWHSLRSTRAMLGGPRQFEATVSIKLPTGYESELPPPLRLESPLYSYTASFARRGRSLTASRRFIVKVPSVAADEWPAFANALSDIRAYEHGGARVWSPQN